MAMSDNDKKRIDTKLYAMTEHELFCAWLFRWNDTKSVTVNLHKFFRMLELYKSRCLRWEVYHRGSCGAIERVRTLYVIPKIKVIEEDLYMTVWGKYN